MTREEAIEILKDLSDCSHIGSLASEDVEALDMAIKALEQEPCEDMERKIEKEYLFESLCEDLKKLQAENENLRKALEQEPTTKNDLPHCQHTDAEIAKSFIEDVEAVKDQLPTTKNDLGVNAVNRQAVIDAIFKECSGTKLDIDFAKVLMLQRAINALPSVTPQKSEWEQDHAILKAYSDGANEVLEKIRAEIEAIIGEHNWDDYDFCSGLICARKIIDKYKEESEVEQ